MFNMVDRLVIVLTEIQVVEAGGSVVIDCRRVRSSIELFGDAIRLVIHRKYREP
jgi:hypothetical protein